MSKSGLGAMYVKDLEILRRQVNFLSLSIHQCVGVILNKQFNYVPFLVELLQRMDQKVLVIECEDTRYSFEFLSKNHFHNFLREQARLYDKVFVVTNAFLKASKAYKLRELCQSLLITLDEESLEDLYPYIEWQRQNLAVSTIYVSY